MTNDEINKENRDTLLDRMEASGGYHDQDQYPYGLMNEASKEIELLRSERDEAREISKKYEDRFFGAVIERDDARWWAKEAIDALIKERDEARKTCCRLWQKEDSGYITCKRLAEDLRWDCFTKEETQ